MIIILLLNVLGCVVFYLNNKSVVCICEGKNEIEYNEILYYLKELCFYL